MFESLQEERRAAVRQTRETEGSRSTLRQRLLRGLPVAETRLTLAGVPTAVLEGGEGLPMVLLHGPGESAVKWLRVIPEMVRRYRVVAPDLPAHGGSDVPGPGWDAQRIITWLDELIEHTCSSPPVLVGQVLGGAIAARFAIRRGDRIRGLVLVDTLGLAPFRPAPRFALTMIHFLARPGEATYKRFMRQCSYDLDRLSAEMGDRWEPFVAYNVELTRSARRRAAGRLLREAGLPPIPAQELARIAVPTDLIWGRQDRATRLRVAEEASIRYGWPLHVIENCADDPARDEPAAFLRALFASTAVTTQVPHADPPAHP